MSIPAVPDGHYPPFAVVTPTDHSAWIIIGTAFGLSCVLLFSVIRICIRLTISPPFGLDDVFVGSATVLSVVQSAITLYAASLGLGKSIELVTPDALVKVQKLFYASTILFIIALGLSKCSIVALLLRMTRKKRQLRIFRATLVLLALWTVASTFATALRCNLKHPWILVGERCPGFALRLQVFGALDAATELIMVSLAIYLVWNLQLSKTNKAIVVIAFCLRFPIIVAIGFRLHSFDAAGLAVNPTLVGTLFIIWSQTEVDFSIIASTIPTLRRFVSGLATYYGALDQKKANEESSYEIRSGSQMLMSQLTATGKSADHDGRYPLQTEATSTNAPYGRNNLTGNHCWATAHVMAQDTNSVQSNDSQQMIIKKDVAWTVERAPEKGSQLLS